MSDNGNEFPLVSETGKRYKVNGDGNYEYESGVILDGKTKKLIRPYAPTVITPSDARERQLAGVQAKENKRLAAARLGLKRGAGTENAHDALAVIVEDQTKLALSDKRGKTAAARLALELAEMVPEKGKLSQQGMAEAVAGATRDITEAAMRILAGQQRENEENIIDV